MDSFVAGNKRRLPIPVLAQLSVAEKWVVRD
jgi:hypothetical protein